MITRKRAALRREEQRVRDLRNFWCANFDPLMGWSIARIRRLSHQYDKAGRRTRHWRTVRSRFQYGCRTGGRW